MRLNLLWVGVVLLGAVNAQAETRTWLAPDFYVDTVDVGEAWTVRTPLRATDCRAQIGAALCVVTSRFEPAGNSMSRGCDADDTKYRAFFEAVYDRLPQPLQKMFCSVDAIYVEPGLESIAYAGMRGGSAVMGFRKSVIDEGLDLSTVLSWKEQLPFGGVHDSYDLAPDLPKLMTHSNDKPLNDLAYYVLVHEFGHLFDFANHLNTQCFPGAACRPEPGSWTAISWQNTNRPKADSDFPERHRICYYQCGGHVLPKSAIASVYQNLSQTNFITLYASTNVYDDLAESLAFYYLEKEGDFSFGLDTQQGATYDLLAKVNAPLFAAKRAYLEAFLQRTDIRYP